MLNGHFTIILYYVSAKKMSTVVMSVLRTLGKFKVDEAELPKQTFSKLIFQEANLVSSRQVAEELHFLVNSTLHSDGTSRNGEKVLISKQWLAMASTEQQVLWMSKVLMPNLGLSSLSWTSWLVWLLPIHQCLVQKQCFPKKKNTMGDQGASKKYAVHKLEQYLSEILRDVMSNWDALSEEEKKDLSSMNHLFCNLHAVIGFADYSDSALKSLEGRFQVSSSYISR